MNGFTAKVEEFDKDEFYIIIEDQNKDELETFSVETQNMAEIVAENFNCSKVTQKENIEETIMNEIQEFQINFHVNKDLKMLKVTILITDRLEEKHEEEIELQEHKILSIEELICRRMDERIDVADYIIIKTENI